MKMLGKIITAAVLFYSTTAFSQNAGDVTQNAFAIGMGAGQQGFQSLLCTNAQLAVGQTAAAPICRTITGDVTIDATGTTAIGAGRVTNGMLAGSIAASKLVGSDIATVGTITAGTWSATTIAINKGGTAQVTAQLARSVNGLNVDGFTGHGDSIYTILASDRVVGTNAAFTASRTWTLPAATSVNLGQSIVVADFQGTVTAGNTLVITRAGSDTINGGTTVTINSANGAYILWSDGGSKWTAQAIGASGTSGVSSIGGLSGAVGLGNGLTTSGGNVLVDNTAWSTFTPTIVCGVSGTVAGYTTNAGRYKIFGKSVWFTVDLLASGAGTCLGSFNVASLPFTSGAGRYSLSGYDFSGGSVTCDLQSGASQCVLATSTNGNVVVTHHVTLTGVAETN